MNWTHLLVNSNSQIEFLKSRDVLLKIMSKYNKKNSKWHIWETVYY